MGIAKQGIKAYKQRLCTRLQESEEYAFVPLEQGHKQKIAQATINGLFTNTKQREEALLWPLYLKRFRRCVEKALQYADNEAVQFGKTVAFKLDQYSFSVPEDIADFEGIYELKEMIQMVMLLQDILDVLRYLKKRSEIKKQYKGSDRQLQLRALEQQVDLGLSAFPTLKSSSFKDVCASWGFSFQVSARTLLRRGVKISQQSGLAVIILHFERAHQQLLRLIQQHWPYLKSVA